PTGTTGSTAPSASMNEPKFILTNASSSGSSSSSATTGTTGAASRSGAASEYRLDASDAKLTPHVGHKVEITGTLDTASASPSSPTASASTSTAPKLKVDDVKMVAPTCP